jgi:hypothetical protein
VENSPGLEMGVFPAVREPAEKLSWFHVDMVDIDDIW